MKTPTFKQRFQYWFDNYMSRGAAVKQLLDTGSRQKLAIGPSRRASISIRRNLRG